jgi:hypothetical protein
MKEPIRIHLHSRSGIYTVVRKNMKSKTLLITCHRWNALKGHPKQLVTKTVKFSDFKCMVGRYGSKARKIKMNEAITTLIKILRT